MLILLLNKCKVLSKRHIAFIAVIILMVLNGCGPPLLIYYDSTIGDPNAIRAKARISVQFDRSIEKQSLWFKPETKKSITEAIEQDLHKNVFVNGEEELEVWIEIKEYYLDLPSEIFFLDVMLLWPFQFFGVPIYYTTYAAV